MARHGRVDTLMEWAFLILGVLVWFELIALRRAAQVNAAILHKIAQSYTRWEETMPPADQEHDAAYWREFQDQQQIQKDM
jgi:hypothetical protein